MIELNKFSLPDLTINLWLEDREAEHDDVVTCNWIYIFKQEIKWGRKTFIMLLITREEFDKELIEWSFPWKNMFVAKLHFFFFLFQERKALGKQRGRSYVIKVLHSIVWLKTLWFRVGTSVKVELKVMLLITVLIPKAPHYCKYYVTMWCKY